MRGLGAAVAVLAVLAVLAGGCGDRQQDDPGPYAAKARVEQYVQALNGNRAEDVARIVGREAGSPDVTRRLRVYGGRALDAVEVRVSSEFPRIYLASVLARDGAGERVHFEQVVEWQDGAWDFAPFREEVTLPSPSPT